MSRLLKSSSGRLKHMAAGVASGAAAGFVLNPLLLPAGAIAGGFYGNKVYCENAVKEARIKELGIRFDKTSTTCASCGAPKSKKGGLGNCYGCGKLFCSTCREKSHAFTYEEEDIKVNLKVCDSCHEDLQCIAMTDSGLGDDGSEPSAPLYDFSSFQAAAASGPLPSAFDTQPGARSGPPGRAVPAYASGLGHVPDYAAGKNFASFESSSCLPSQSQTPSSLYPSLDNSPSAPCDDYGMVPIPLHDIPDLSTDGGDRLDRVMKAAAFFPDAPDNDLPMPSAPVETGDVTRVALDIDSSSTTLMLDTNTGPDLQFACEEVARVTIASAADEKCSIGISTASSVANRDRPVGDEDTRQEWEASWNLPPAVLAQRALGRLKLSDGDGACDAQNGAGEELVSTPVEAAAAASLFPDAPDHDL